MNLPRLLFLFLFTTSLASAQEVKITSPDEAKTFIYGSLVNHRLLWKEKEQQFLAEVTFSNSGYSSSDEPTQNETFTFRIPGIVYDKERHLFFAPDGHGHLLPVAERKEQWIGSSIQPLPQTAVRVIRLKGNVQVILESDPSALTAPANTNDTQALPLNSLISH